MMSQEQRAKLAEIARKAKDAGVSEGLINDKPGRGRTVQEMAMILWQRGHLPAPSVSALLDALDRIVALDIRDKQRLTTTPAATDSQPTANNPFCLDYKSMKMEELQDFFAKANVPMEQRLSMVGAWMLEHGILVTPQPTSEVTRVPKRRSYRWIPATWVVLTLLPAAYLIVFVHEFWSVLAATGLSVFGLLSLRIAQHAGQREIEELSGIHPVSEETKRKIDELI